MSMEMTATETNTNNKSFTRGATRGANLKNSSNMGNTTNSMFLNNRSSAGNKTRGSQEDMNSSSNAYGLNTSMHSNNKIMNQREVRLPHIKQ